MTVAGRFYGDWMTSSCLGRCHGSFIWAGYKNGIRSIGLCQDRRVSRPLSKSEQIRQTLHSYIDSGQLAAGQQLPAERALSERFATTRITVKEALSALEAEGLIYRAERRGWFVAPPRLIYDPARHTHFHQWIAEQQRSAETRLLGQGGELASSELCRWMDIDPFTPLYQIRRQRLIDGRPVLHVSHHLLASRFPWIEEQPLAGSLTELYLNEYGIGQGGARLEMTPVAARGEVASVLNLAQGSPVLRLVRVNYDEGGGLIDCDIEHWRHDAIRICLDTRPQGLAPLQPSMLGMRSSKLW